MKKSDENDGAIRYLDRANSTSEWIMTFYLKYLAVSIIGLMATSLLSVLCCYLTRRDFNVDYLYRPGKFVYEIQLFKLCMDHSNQGRET